MPEAEQLTDAPRWRDVLATAARVLDGASEARWIAEVASGVAGAALFARLDEVVEAETLVRFNEFVRRRRAGEPLQHVLGSWPFRTVELVVDARALVPRPETEFVVEVALLELRRLERNHVRALDLGSGSGAIACALVAEAPHLDVVAVEVSPAALELAAINVARLPADAADRVVLVAGSWYESLDPSLHGRVDLIVSNPPYLAASEWADLEPVVADFDPYGALVAGERGTEAIEAVIDGAPAWLSRPGALVVELAPSQGAAAIERARSVGADEAEVLDDLAGRARVLRARWR